MGFTNHGKTFLYAEDIAYLICRGSAEISVDWKGDGEFAEVSDVNSILREGGVPLGEYLLNFHSCDE